MNEWNWNINKTLTTNFLLNKPLQTNEWIKFELQTNMKKINKNQKKKKTLGDLKKRSIVQDTFQGEVEIWTNKPTVKDFGKKQRETNKHKERKKQHEYRIKQNKHKQT